MDLTNGAGAAAAETASEARREDVSSKPTKRQSWRDVLPVHPAADLFPMMSEAELLELANDINKNGLREKVSVYNDPVIGDCVLDGRNRLDALALIGQLWDDTGNLKSDIGGLVGACSVHYPNFEPYAFVISKNIHRRHLTADQKRDLIVAVLKAQPHKSNRQVAKEVGASHPHIAKVRREAEKTGDVETVSTSIDTKGRKQPAKRKPDPPVAKVKAEVQKLWRQVKEAEAEAKRKPAVQESFDSPQEAHGKAVAKKHRIALEDIFVPPVVVTDILLAQLEREEIDTDRITPDEWRRGLKLIDQAEANLKLLRANIEQRLASLKDNDLEQSKKRVAALRKEIKAAQNRSAGIAEASDDLAIPEFLRRGAA